MLQIVCTKTFVVNLIKENNFLLKTCFIAVLNKIVNQFDLKHF